MTSFANAAITVIVLFLGLITVMYAADEGAQDADQETTAFEIFDPVVETMFGTSPLLVLVAIGLAIIAIGGWIVAGTLGSSNNRGNWR